MTERWQAFWTALGLLALALLVCLVGRAQAQTTQCVTNVAAQGTVNAITSAPLPCGTTTNLVLLTTLGANTSTTVTYQPVGSPALPITRPLGVALSAGDLPGAGFIALLTPTGSSWVLLNPASVSGGLTVGATTIAGGTSGQYLYDNAGVLGNAALSIAVGAITGLGTGVGAALAVPLNAANGLSGINGTLTPGDCLKWSTGGIQDQGVACGNSSGITVGSTSIAGGSSGDVEYNNAGTLGELPTTGSGSVVLSNAPVLVTPNLGVPSFLTLTNATGLPISGLAGLGTGVGAALASPIPGSGAMFLQSGSVASGDCVYANGSGLADRGSACRPVIDVTRAPYSADPTGTTNATTAINAAFTAAATSNACVYFPAGTYYVTNELDAPASNGCIFGDSSLSTTIRAYNSVSGKTNFNIGQQVTATASFVTGATTISVSSCPTVSAGQNIYDASNWTFLGTIASCSGTTLTLQTGIATCTWTYPSGSRSDSAGTADVLMLGGAGGVLVLPDNCGGNGDSVNNIGFDFQQPQTNIRANIVPFPPALRLKDSGRHRIVDIRVGDSNICLDARSAGSTENPPDYTHGSGGGVFLTRMECGALTVGMQWDGAKDNVHWTDFHFWNFGGQIGGGNPLNAVFSDGTTGCFTNGRVDGLLAANIACFKGNSVVTANNGQGSGNVPDQAFTGFSADNRSFMSVAAGDIYVTGGHASPPSTSTFPNLNVTGGVMRISKYRFAFGAQTSVPVTVTGNGKLYISDSTITCSGGIVQCGTVNGGDLEISHTTIFNSAISSAAPMFEEISGEMLFDDNLFFSSTAATFSFPFTSATVSSGTATFNGTGMTVLSAGEAFVVTGSANATYNQVYTTLSSSSTVLTATPVGTAPTGTSVGGTVSSSSIGVQFDTDAAFNHLNNNIMNGWAIIYPSTTTTGYYENAGVVYNDRWLLNGDGASDVWNTINSPSSKSVYFNLQNGGVNEWKIGNLGGSNTFVLTDVVAGASFLSLVTGGAATIGEGALLSFNGQFTDVGAHPTYTGTCPVQNFNGGSLAGRFAMNGACAAGTVIETFASSTAHGFACDAHDITTPADTVNETAYSTNSVTLTGTMANGDVVVFKCIGF